MDQPRVSILVPTRDRRAFLPQLLTYVRRQTWPRDHLQLVVIDDGLDPVDDLFTGITDLDVVYEHVGQRIPLGAKRNRTVERSDGEILVQMDDDDWHPADRVAKAVAALADPAVQLVGTSTLAFWDVATDGVHLYPPIGPKHAHAGTLSFKRAYWDQHKYAPDAHTEERQFTRCFNAPLAQLPGPPWETVLCISHGGNALPKNTRLPRAPITLADVVTDPGDRAFYASLVDEDW